MIRTNENQNSDFEWYKEHLKELYDQYGECIVVIKNKKVLGTYATDKKNNIMNIEFIHTNL